MHSSMPCDAHIYYLHRLTGVGVIPYLTSEPSELDAIAHLVVDGLIEAHLPPMTPTGWKGTATVFRVCPGGYTLLRRLRLT